MSSISRYYPFVSVSGNLGGKIPIVDDVLSSHKEEIYPTTSIVENCIEFEFQMDWNYCVALSQTYLAFKMKLVRGRIYETCKSKEIKKEHKEEAKVDVETVAEEQEARVFLVTLVNNILHLCFSNVEMYINNQQIYNS